MCTLLSVPVTGIGAAPAALMMSGESASTDRSYPGTTPWFHTGAAGGSIDVVDAESAVLAEDEQAANSATPTKRMTETRRKFHRAFEDVWVGAIGRPPAVRSAMVLAQLE
jgi:hypothetical protein